MSYSTSMTGRVEITPPLTWFEIKDSKHYSPAGETPSFDTDLVFEIETEERQMPEGILTIERAVAVVPGDYETTGRTAQAELVELIEVFGHAHTFSGRIDGEGERTGYGPDLWRLKAIDGMIEKFVPKIVWPAESE